ncbi:MAG: hypothetical protein E7232_13935 [Lachnospiraceae bacterium]|nr:hypothetical protein [Lachnospiraceae bacterium]
MRSKSFSIVLLILCCLFVVLPSGQVHAEEKTGYWLFTGAEKEDASENVYVNELADATSEVDYGSVKVTMVYTEEYGEIKKGTKRTIISSWTTPESRYESGDTVSMEVSLSCKDNTQKEAYFPSGNFSADIVYDGHGTDYFSNSEGDSYLYVGEDGPESYSEKLSCSLRSGKEEGDKMEIEISCTGGKVTYTYKWIDTTPRVKCRWNLKDTQTEGAKIVLKSWNNYASNSWEVEDPNDVGNAKTRYIYKVSPGSFSTNYTAIQALYSATLGMLEEPAGFSATSTCTYTEPKDYYYAGDLMDLTLTANGVYTTVECDFDDKSWTMDTSISAYVFYTSAKSPDEAKSRSTSHYTMLEYEEGEDTVRSSKEAHSNTKMVSAELEDASYYGPDSEDQSYMVLKVNNNSGSMIVYYIYQWEPYETENPDSGVGQEITVPKGSGFTRGDDDSIIDKINAEVFKEAGTTPGEDEGTNIPAAIFVTVAGGAAAAGAAGASSSKGKNKDKRKSTFKLFVYKDFGNAIRKGDAPKYVYARIGEITPEGNEIDRPDLSVRIKITSTTNGFNVTEYGMSGNYKCAHISADKEFPETDGIVSFVFAYEGGTFTENVRFHLAGDPYIEFPDMDRLAITHVVNGLFGDGETYEVPFIIKDFFGQLDTSEIKISARENDLILSCTKDERMAEFGQSFKAVLLNRSAKNDTRRRSPIIIEASKGEEHVEGSFYFELYPEGLSIDGKKVDGRLQIKSYREAEQFDESVLIEQTNFYPTLAVAENDGARRIVNIVDFRYYPLEIGPIQADAPYMSNFIEKYSYHIDDRALYTDASGMLSFYPELNIPEGKQPYYVCISFRCSYGGTDYFLTQPMRLLGEPLKPMSKKETEIMYLESFIRKYMVDEERDAMLERVRAKYEVFSDSEIKAMRQDLWIKMRDRMMAVGAQQKLWGDILDWTYCGLDWCKWIGDICFSILVSTYAGPLAEAIISPAKDILTASLGETADYLISGRPFDYKNLQVFSNMETMAENIITKDMKLTSWSGIKQAGHLLALFYVLNVFKNYVTRIEQEGVCDLYGAIIDGFSNMTSLFAKALAGERFKKFLESKSFKSALGTKLGKWIQDQIKYKYTALIDTARAKKGIYKYDGLNINDYHGDIDWMTDWNFYKFTKSDLFGKCIEEIAGGDSVAKGILAVQYEEPKPEDLEKSGVYYYRIYKKQYEVEKDVWLKIDFIPMFNNAMDTMSKLYDTIFDFFFVAITFDTKPRELAKDPPLQGSGITQ